MGKKPDGIKMFTYQITPWSFFGPFGLVIAGAYLQNKGWMVPGWLAYLLALAAVVWMFYYTHVTQGANNNSFEEKKIETFLKLSPEQRAELGYKKTASKIDIVHHYIDNRGFEPRTSFDWIPWSPGKLQEFILATLRGVKPTFANWEGGDKLFHDGEFEPGMNKFLEPDIAYFVKRGTASNSPREITDLGLLAFVEFVEDLGIGFDLTPEYRERIIKIREAK